LKSYPKERTGSRFNLKATAFHFESYATRSNGRALVMTTRLTSTGSGLGINFPLFD
jgi:hypothetical protein